MRLYSAPAHKEALKSPSQLYSIWPINTARKDNFREMVNLLEKRSVIPSCDSVQSVGGFMKRDLTVLKYLINIHHAGFDEWSERCEVVLLGDALRSGR